MTVSEGKALGWYATQYNLRPQLSVPPFQMNFTRRDDGSKVTKHLDGIVAEYKAAKKDEAKQRARDRKREAK